MFLSNLSSKIKLVTNIVTKICQPNQKLTRNPLDHRSSHERNISLVAFHAILFLYSFAEFIFKARPETSCVIDMLYSSFFVAILFTSCKYPHPEVFRFSFSLLYALYGLYIAHMNQEEGVILAILWSLISPMYAFICTWSLWHSLSQAIFQICCLQFLYGEKLQSVHVELDPQIFSENLVHVSMKIILMAGMVMMICYLQFKSLERGEILIVDDEREKSQKENFIFQCLDELEKMIENHGRSLEQNRLSPDSQEMKAFGEVLLNKMNNIQEAKRMEEDEIRVENKRVNILKTMGTIWNTCSVLMKRKELVGNMRIQRNIPKTMILDASSLKQIIFYLVRSAVEFTPSSRSRDVNTRTSSSNLQKGSVNMSVEWIENINDKCFEPFPFNDEDEQEEGLFEKSRQFGVFENSFVFNGQTSNVEDLDSEENKFGIPGRQEGVLKVIISDNGYGISKKKLEQLSNRDTVYSEFAIIRRVCEHMGGDIRVFSKKDRGTSIIVCIPVRPIQVVQGIYPDQKFEEIKKTFKAKRLRAMVVDDLHLCNQIHKLFFDQMGIEVVDIALNGKEAYEKYQNRVDNSDFIDIITMDLVMPVMRGEETIQKIRKLEASKNLKPSFIIIITSEVIPGKEDMKRMYHADLVILQPTTFKELVQGIANHFAPKERNNGIRNWPFKGRNSYYG